MGLFGWSKSKRDEQKIAEAKRRVMDWLSAITAARNEPNQIAAVVTANEMLLMCPTCYKEFTVSAGMSAVEQQRLSAQKGIKVILSCPACSAPVLMQHGKTLNVFRKEGLLMKSV